MFKRLLPLEWKRFFRSASMGKSLALKIFLGFIGLYFIGIALITGIGLYPIIKKLYPDAEPLYIANNFILIWFSIELVYRFFLQTLPVLDIKPFLVLPIIKKRIVNFLLVKSLLSFYNLLPLLIIIPFGIYNIYKSELPVISIVAWILAVIALTFCVNYINFIIKKRFTDNLKALIPVAILVLVLALLDYYKIFQITHYFGKGMNLILKIPWLVIIPFLLLILLYKWNQINLLHKFYLDASLSSKNKSANTREFGWTRHFGEIAPFLQQDLKLIWRNKRAKATLYMAGMFLFYGLLFYTQDTYVDKPWFFVFVGIFITGIFMLNFGQFIPSWDAGYYPLIMSQNIPMHKYLKAKAILITFSIVILTILATPYVYFGWRILVLNIICAIYNIGINTTVLLYSGSFNRKRIDLDKSPFMNYQGTGAAQWIVSIPLMVVPVAMFYGFYKLVSFESGMIFLFTLGTIGIIIRGRAIKSIARVYKRNKYAMIEGFKQKGD